MDSTSTSSLSHKERTAAEPREHGTHKVILDGIEQANKNVRLLRLRRPAGEQPIQFLPGQWLDVHVPGILQAGGFTITSTPQDLRIKNYLELAVQNSPRNPPAAFLWQEASKILGSELVIRVGGSFVWPPPGTNPTTIERLVFIAGGIGINPLISILSHLHQNRMECPPNVEFIYSVRKDPSSKISSILFLGRLRSLFPPSSVPSRNYKVFLSNAVNHSVEDVEKRSQAIEAFKAEAQYSGGGNIEAGRIKERDLFKAIGPVEKREGVLAYVCGPPPMTDWAVAKLRNAEGMEELRVLCEKWW